MFILYKRQYHQIHEPLYKGGFARPYGTHHAYVNLAACAFTDITVDIKLRISHSIHPSHLANIDK
jgi:hypothetical protein